MNFLTINQLYAKPPGLDVVFDIEIFKNFTLVEFKFVGSDDYFVAWMDESNPVIDKLAITTIFSKFKVIGFNSNHYDIPITSLILSGMDCPNLKRASDTIIQDNVQAFNFEKVFKVPLFKPSNHIDINNVIPGNKISLKTYGARIHCRKIQELPIAHDTYLTDEQKGKIVEYCGNDLEVTELIWSQLSEQMQIRDDVMSRLGGVDVRSKSDAQMAETMMKVDLERNGFSRAKAPELSPSYSFNYDPPEWVSFISPDMQRTFDDIKNATFCLKPDGGIDDGEVLSKRLVTINGTDYRMGIGGLHSCEKSQAVIPGTEELLLDRDVSSYYPAIVLNNELHPEHIPQKVFTKTYREYVDLRLAAKARKSKSEAETYKIAVNGLYGKFGSPYSVVFSPKCMLQVTLTGQLALLMLIEALELCCGIRVKSANTDGIVFLVPTSRKEEIDGVFKMWENVTGFATEETQYRGLYSRDVNNYVAIKMDGQAKTKGACSLPEGVGRFSKNPEHSVVMKAVIEFLNSGKPVQDTINESKNIEDFVRVRNVTGGGIFCGEDVGKVVRYYLGRHSDSHITYKRNGNKVPASEGAVMCQQLPDTFPNDIDYAKYVELAETTLVNIGAVIPESDVYYLFTPEEL